MRDFFGGVVEDFFAVDENMGMGRFGGNMFG